MFCRTWSKIRVAMKGVDCGQIIWDDIRKVLIAHYATVVPAKDNGSPGNGATLEYRSTDLGAKRNQRLFWSHF